jgi:hypothetical protein
VELRFLIDAQQQVIKCRRVLKWTYALGYYWTDDTKRVFFEHQQGNLEKVPTSQTTYRQPKPLGSMHCACLLRVYTQTVDIMHGLAEKPIKDTLPDDSAMGATVEFNLCAPPAFFAPAARSSGRAA